MPRCKTLIPMLALCAALFCANLALAAAPPAKEGLDIDPAAVAKAAAAEAALKSTLSAAQQQAEQTGQQVRPALGTGAGAPAAPAPAPRPGGRKVIYGDIIIHK